MIRRYLECAVFVGVWMACGRGFRLSPEGYQMLGLAMVVVFQFFIARRPLRQLWVREAEVFRLDQPGIFLAVGLALLAAVGFLLPIVPRRWSLLVPCAIVWLIPAIPAAFAIRSQRADRLRSALPSFAAALVIGWATVLALGWVNAHSIGFDRTKLALLLPNLGMQFVSCFVVEEVVFRGALDTHVAPLPGSLAREWGSAVFVAALWTAWHIPADLMGNSPGHMAQVLLWRLPTFFVGVGLSFCWRKCGTLALPAAAHALINAYRATFPF